MICPDLFNLKKGKYRILTTDLPPTNTSLSKKYKYTLLFLFSFLNIHHLSICFWCLLFLKGVHICSLFYNLHVTVFCGPTYFISFSCLAYLHILKI